jgi:peptidoglycan/xylan/chitin deacetylase (PgdA/CDA1 family)
MTIIYASLENLTVIMYHYVRNPGDRAEAGSGIRGLSVERFEAQLDALARKHEMIGWTDLAACLQGQKPLPPSACLLTFDDGLRDHYFNVFPALRARGLSGLFFALARAEGTGLALGHQIHFLLAALGVERLRKAVWNRLNPGQQETFRLAEQRYRLQHEPATPDGPVNVLKLILQRELSADAGAILSAFCEQYIGVEVELAERFYVNQAQIREMAAGGMHFGGHSRSHPWFDWIGADQQEEEMAASATMLRDIEPGPWAFAYPYGGLSTAAPELLQAHGFAAAFTTVAQVHHTDPYFIGRLDGEALSPSFATEISGHDA